MREECFSLIKEFESRIENLLQKYYDCRQKSSKLESDLEQKQNELMYAHSKFVKLQEKYDNLLMAKASVLLSKGDTKHAKQQLSRLIKEIDICITKLGE